MTKTEIKEYWSDGISVKSTTPMVNGKAHGTQKYFDVEGGFIQDVEWKNGIKVPVKEKMDKDDFIICDKCDNYRPCPSGQDAYSPCACVGDFSTMNRILIITDVMNCVDKKCYAFKKMGN